MKLILILVAGGSLFAQTSSFPGSAVTDSQLKVQVNGIQTSLAGNITSGATSATVVSCSGIAANTLATIDSEIIPVSSCSGTVISFSSRGFDGTTAAAHSTGALVSLFVDAWHHNALRVEVEAIESLYYSGGQPTLTGLTTTGFVISPIFNANIAGLSGSAKTFQNSDGSFTVDYLGNGSAQSFIENFGTFVGQTSAPALSAAGRANLYYNSTNQEFYVSYGGGAYSGFKAPVFNGVVLGLSAGAKTFQNSDGSWSADYQGNIAAQSLALTNGLTVGGGTYGISTGGVLTVASCSGCAGSAVLSFNTRTGAVSLLKADVTAVDQALGTGDSPTFAGVTATAVTGSMVSPIFNANVSGLGGGAKTFQNSDGSYTVSYLGAIAGQTLALTNGLTVDSGAYGLSATGVLTAATASTIGGLTVSSGLTISAGSISDSVSVNGYVAVFQNAFGAGTGGITVTTTGTGYTISGSTGRANSMILVDSGGTCTVGTGVAGVACASDERLKENIRPVGLSLNSILALNPVEYEWIGNGNTSDGFIAQEVQKYFPLTVHEGEDGKLQLSYVALIPYLIQAIKEQQIQIDSLRKYHQ